MSKLSDYLSKRTLKKYSKAYVRKMDKTNENYIAENADDLIDKVKKYYGDISTKDLDYEKNKLKLTINSYREISLFNYTGVMMPLLMGFISGVASIVVTYPKADKGEWIKVLFSALIICVVSVATSYFIDILVTSRYSKSFDMMRLDIVEELIEKKKKEDEMNELEKARQESAVTLENERKAKRTIIKIISKVVKALR